MVTFTVQWLQPFPWLLITTGFFSSSSSLCGFSYDGVTEVFFGCWSPAVRSPLDVESPLEVESPLRVESPLEVESHASFDRFLISDLV